MKSILLKGGLVFGLCLILCSCNSDDPEPGSGTFDVDVTFLKVGAKATFFYNDGWFNVDSLYLQVEKQLAPDTFLVRYSSETIAVSPTQYWVLKDNNLYMSIRLRDPDTYWLECQFGKGKGTTWNVTKLGIPYTYSIEDINTTVKIKNREITDAVKVKIVSPTGQTSFQYYSPSEGILGNGSIDEDVLMKPVHVTAGTTNTTSNTIPSISFGSFPFMAVGKYWNYQEYSLFGDPISVKLSIESKQSDKNIYKVKLTYDTDISYQYWYEDNGLLMAFEEGENYLNADPLYMDEAKATIGYGWGSYTSSKKFYIYKIANKNQSVSTYFGTLSCLAVSVSDGMFEQTNYWTKNKGNVLVDGWVEREVVASNARRADSSPLIGPLPIN